MSNVQPPPTPTSLPGSRRRAGRFVALLAMVAALAATDGHRAAPAQERTPAVDAPPSDSDVALRERAVALRQERRLDGARDLYRALLTRDPSFEDRFWLAKLEGWTGNFATAESLFVRLLAERPDDYDSRIGLADVRLWAGRYDAADADLTALDRAHPNDAEVLVRLGRVREAAGNPRAARSYFARALRADPAQAEARTALRRVASTARWDMGIEYYGEQLSRALAAHGATASVESRGNRFRWRGAATVQQKFDRTEARVGGELGHRLSRSTELRWSAYVAPGAEVLPRQTYGVRLAQKTGPLVLYVDYALLDFADAHVHQVSPRLELYAGPHWVLSGRYAHAVTSFTGAQTVGNNAASVSAGYLYGGANLLQLFAAAGGESFALPSRDAIGGFGAHTIGVAWRHFVTPLLGLTLSYSHQGRSDGANRDAWGIGLIRRW